MTTPGEMGAPFHHVPVLAAEVVRELMPALEAAPGGTLVDCTVGGGGHAEALLAAAPGASLVGLDRDPEALDAAAGRLARFGDRVVLAHRARRTFQALRIEVNNELGELEASLPQAIEALRPGGRVAVISYHSLEDRLVKRTFVDAAAGCRCPRDLPVCVCGARAVLRVVTRKPLRPAPEELEANPRASSAMLRVAERLALPEVS